MRSYVVVGVDGSASSVAAAQYAADWAALFGWDLHLLRGYRHDDEPDDDSLQRIETSLAARHPRLAIARHRMPGGGAAALVEESRHADLTVVGSRGAGSPGAVPLGATATIVATHAHGPVVVIRPPGALPGPGNPVLVGVDGSDHSVAALDFAFDVATATGAAVVATHVWWAGPLASVADGGHIPADAGRALSEALEPWRQKYPDVALTETLVHSSDPAAELVDASAEAGLVVVGTRGHGGFAGLLLGSVSLSVAQHARCPVAIVGPARPDRQSQREPVRHAS